MKRKYGIRKLLRMLVEWHEAQRERDTQEQWWRKYPTLSCNDVIKLARKKLNEKRVVR